MSAFPPIANVSLCTGQTFADEYHALTMEEDVIEKMRARVQKCRLLARQSHDDRIAEALLQRAGEGEADILRLEAERDA